MKRRAASLALAASSLLAACGENKPEATAPVRAPVQTGEAAPAIDHVAPMDYAQAGAWLCRPELDDACEQVATATSVAADGRLTGRLYRPRQHQLRLRPARCHGHHRAAVKHASEAFRIRPKGRGWELRALPRPRA